MQALKSSEGSGGISYQRIVGRQRAPLPYVPIFSEHLETSFYSHYVRHKDPKELDLNCRFFTTLRQDSLLGLLIALCSIEPLLEIKTRLD